jgi:hypothetical protein
MGWFEYLSGQNRKATTAPAAKTTKKRSVFDKPDWADDDCDCSFAFGVYRKNPNWRSIKRRDAAVARGEGA